MTAKSTQKQFTVYFIFRGDDIIYVGRTAQPLSRRLHGHTHRKPMYRDIDALDIDRVEYVTFDTQADMFLYEIYYINLYKPWYNSDDKASDDLTCRLPERARQTWDNQKLLEKWKDEERERKENNRWLNDRLAGRLSRASHDDIDRFFGNAEEPGKSNQEGGVACAN